MVEAVVEAVVAVGMVAGVDVEDKPEDSPGWEAADTLAGLEVCAGQFGVESLVVTEMSAESARSGVVVHQGAE